MLQLFTMDVDVNNARSARMTRLRLVPVKAPKPAPLTKQQTRKIAADETRRERITKLKRGTR